VIAFAGSLLDDFHWSLEETGAPRRARDERVVAALAQGGIVRAVLRRALLLAPFALAACGFDTSGTGDGLVIRRDGAVVGNDDTGPLFEDTFVPEEDAIFATEDTGLAVDTGLVVDTGPESPLPGCTVELRATHEYLFCELDANWDQARTSCQVPGYDLVIVNDKAEHDWIVSKLKSKSREQWHIGLNDRASEGSFKWVDGSSPGFTSWGTWEPNDFFGEDCVVLTKGGAWNDVGCGDGPHEAFICETP